MFWVVVSFQIEADLDPLYEPLIISQTYHDAAHAGSGSVRAAIPILPSPL